MEFKTAIYQGICFYIIRYSPTNWETFSYVGSEKKLKQHFAENVFEGKTRVVFVADEILPDHITCFEYLDSIRKTKNYKNPDDTLEGLLEFAKIDKNANVGSLSVGERSRLLLTGVILLRAEDYVLCGL